MRGEVLDVGNGSLGGVRKGKVADSLNLSQETGDVPMTDLCAKDLRGGLVQGFRNWTGGWTDIEDWRADRKNVVDFARVNDTDKRVAHQHQVQVGGGK